MQLRPVQPKVSFPALEQEILVLWEEKNVFRRSVEERDPKRSYTFYDGPPFATGLPHYGHLVASILKDIVPRYWTMQGYRVERQWGWDCHGLPVENETEKELGLEEKRDIEELGIHAFNEACRGIVLRFTREWAKTIRRLGRWVDFEHGYKTMDRDFMESVWWVFKELWKKDLIYSGFRVQPYCPRCGTPLSNFELNQPGGYQDRQDPSITVRVALAGRPGAEATDPSAEATDPSAELWLWTTTPWTLPANTAVAVGPDIDYVEVQTSDGRRVILADARLAHYFPDLEADSVVARMKGSELAGLRYEPLFDFQDASAERQFTVLTAPYVSTEDGSGIVHIAPAFGEDDFVLGQEHDLPIFRPVGPDGRFTELVPPYAGTAVKDADKWIIRDLKASGALVEQRTLDHSYPHCYRCDSPLIYMALDTWFMRIEPIKEQMIAANRTAHWVPESIQEGRFGNWLEGARDWNFSRNRYWGTPIPIWICDQCDARECLGSVGELEQRVGSEVADIHKHFVDDLDWACACGGRMHRISEIFDCWFESGSMPYAQHHYPFENADSWGERFPADYIAEGVDQTRGWFYTLTILSAALTGGPAFRNVIVNGIVLAEDGEKMSKRKKNYPDPAEIFDRYGADALRIYLIDSPVVNARDVKFQEAGIEEHIRSVLLPLWNAYSFLTRYASIDGWTPDGTPPDPAVNELDGWILSRLQTLTGTVEKYMARYELFRVVPALIDYVDELTNWYIRRSRRRFWKEGGGGADKLNAYRTLHGVLLTLSRVLAPFLPFISEEIYRNLSCGQRCDSVHLDDYPHADESLQSPELERRMELARTAVGLGRALRSKHNVRIRQPLREMTLCAVDDADLAALGAVGEIVGEELNVKQVLMSGREADLVSYSARPNLKLLGPRYGKQLGAIRSEVAELTSEQLSGLLGGTPVASGAIEGLAYSTETLLVDRSSREGTVVDSSGGITVALDLSLDEELRREGVAREVINRIQNQRKEMDLELDDRIVVTIGASGAVADAVRAFWRLIAAEVLATNEAPEIVPELAGGAKHTIEGEEMAVSIAKTA